MNRFPYTQTTGEYKGRTPPPEFSSGWSFSDAVIKHDCPKCGSTHGFYCESPAGNKVWPPHGARVRVGPEHRINAINTPKFNEQVDIDPLTLIAVPATCVEVRTVTLGVAPADGGNIPFIGGSRSSSNEQQFLVDIVFQVGLTIASNPALNAMSQEAIAAWIAQQLKDCGFPTTPIGASWGVLVK